MQVILEKSFPSQKGASLLLTLLVIILVLFIATAVIKIGPTYMDNAVLVNTMNAIDESTPLAEMNLRDIQNELLRRLSTNSIRDFDPSSVTMASDRDGRRFVDVNYERRIPMFYNIEAVVVFTNRFDR